MNYEDSLTLITLSDVRLLFRRNLSKIKTVALIGALACFSFLLLKEPKYIAEATFKQGAKSNEIGLSLKETYQQLFASPSEGATVAIMQSSEVLKEAIEALGMQANVQSEFKITRAIKRIRDNLLLELGSSLSELDPFVFSDVSYAGEKPLKLFVQLTEEGQYRLFDQGKKQIAEAKLGHHVAFASSTLTLQKVSASAKNGRLYPLTLTPLADAAVAVKKRIKIAPLKQDKNILKLEYSSRNRFLAADFLNHLMKSYQNFLKRENDESSQAQLEYLQLRQQELTQSYDEALVDHVGYLKESLNKNGFIGVAQETEILSGPKHAYTSRLFDIDLELSRLSPEDSLCQKGSETASESLSLEIEQVGDQIRETSLLIDSLEKQKEVPPLPSLCKDPKSAIALLVKQLSQASIPVIKEVQSQLMQKRKILEENLGLQKREVNDFSGIKLRLSLYPIKQGQDIFVGTLAFQPVVEEEKGLPITSRAANVRQNQRAAQFVNQVITAAEKTGPRL